MQENHETSNSAGQSPAPLDCGRAKDPGKDKDLTTPAEVDRLWMRLAQARPRKPRIEDPAGQRDAG